MLNYMETPDKGKMRINVVQRGSRIPVENAKVSISYSGDPTQVIEEIQIDANGQSEDLSLAAPPLEYSMEPGQNQPYSEYNLKITADGFEPVTVSGSEVLPDVTAYQRVEMDSIINLNQNLDTVVIGPHTLYGDYPPKIAEAEIKPITGTGEIVLSRVVVPEYIIIHDGPVTDNSAADYYERYRDYIKNVAACEIYATWPREALEANILAIMSFTMNRVYTEWYRNKGYDFTITSSTAFDHKWIRGKNTYDTIDTIVDEIFTNYLSRPNVNQPILTQYCDGKRVSCPEWMTQLQVRINMVGRHCSEVEICCKRQPPQAANPAKQDSFLWDSAMFMNNSSILQSFLQLFDIQSFQQ
ncbi:MAG: carboxypeptidase regulatory-like domain-containing protein [Lachnospiraceae bacterium]|nr:carboxypeptidase regulatory-like domain-containing protein [Lachnospiraceae bacterium]